MNNGQNWTGRYKSGETAQSLTCSSFVALHHQLQLGHSERRNCSFLVHCFASSTVLETFAMKLHLLAVFAFVGVALVTVTPTESSQCKVTPKIKDVNTDTMEVTYTLTNTRTVPICIGTTASMLDDTYWAASVGLTTNREQVPYDTPVMPYYLLRLADKDYMVIEPGSKGAVEKKRDLTKVFKFKKGTEYTLNVQTFVVDCYILTDKVCKGRKVEDSEQAEFTKVLFSFTPAKDFADDLSPATIKEWLATLPKEIQDNIEEGAGMTTIGADKKQHKALQEAHNLASEYITAAVKVLLGMYSKQNIELYTTWFEGGAVYGRGYIYEQKVVQNFIALMMCHTHTHVYVVEKCEKGTLAYVPAVLGGKKQHLIFICEASFTDNADIAQTIVHERSHEVCDTDDVDDGNCYGEDQCKEFAKSKPDLALNNADNYGYFAQYAYKNCCTRKKV